MTCSVKVYEPLYTLKAIGEDIWIVDGDVVEMNFNLTQVPFSTRGTIKQSRLVDSFSDSFNTRVKK